MINGYILSAAIGIATVLAAYIFHFYFYLGQDLSKDPGVWGVFGDYTGGLLNPALSFISIVLLIKSLDIQKEANRNLQEELFNSAKTEKTKALDTLLFHMINSQKEILPSLQIAISTGAGNLILTGPSAIRELEEEIARLRTNNQGDKDITDLIENSDISDNIFGTLRAFYVAVKVISDKLSDSAGFTAQDRKERLLTLINFTDFSQLRLILIGMQFMNWSPADYLRSNAELQDVLQETGIKLPLY